MLGENDGLHMRGTECDQKVLSRKKSWGHVLSPNYPYPYIPKTVCRLERMQIYQIHSPMEIYAHIM